MPLFHFHPANGFFVGIYTHNNMNQNQWKFIAIVWAHDWHSLWYPSACTTNLSCWNKHQSDAELVGSVQWHIAWPPPQPWSYHKPPHSQPWISFFSEHMTGTATQSEKQALAVTCRTLATSYSCSPVEDQCRALLSNLPNHCLCRRWILVKSSWAEMRSTVSPNPFEETYSTWLLPSKQPVTRNAYHDVHTQEAIK